MFKSNYRQVSNKLKVDKEYRLSFKYQYNNNIITFLYLLLINVFIYLLFSYYLCCVKGENDTAEQDK